jgi:hypothetical protein
MEQLVFALENWAAATGEWLAALYFLLLVLSCAAYLLFVIWRWRVTLDKPKLADDPWDRLWWYLSGTP